MAQPKLCGTTAGRFLHGKWNGDTGIVLLNWLGIAAISLVHLQGICLFFQLLSLQFLIGHRLFIGIEKDYPQEHQRIWL